MNLYKVHKKGIWQRMTWDFIFQDVKENKDKKIRRVWIERQEKPLHPEFLMDDRMIFDCFVLKCEEGNKNKIPQEYNKYIESEKLEWGIE